MKPSAILWSGGKDSYLSLKLARSRGFEVKTALSYINQYSKRLLTSYIKERVVQKQAESLGLNFLPVYCSKRKNNILDRLEERLKELDINYLITGNVEDREFKFILERLCKPLDIRVVNPLWFYSPEVILERLKRDKALIVCSKVKALVGRLLDAETIGYLRDKGLSLTGEGGLYQSFIATSENYKLSKKLLKRGFYRCVEVEI